MKPAKIYRGDTWLRTWTIKDAAGILVDLTGATARLQVRDAAGVEVMSYTTADSLTLSLPTSTISLAAPYADTEIAAGNYSFDLEVTKGGIRRTYEKNTLVILEDVSRD